MSITSRKLERVCWGVRLRCGKITNLVRDEENIPVLFNSRRDARSAAAWERETNWRFKPKSKGGLGYTVAPVKVRATWQFSA